MLHLQGEMTTDLGSNFNSRKKFVEGLESLVPAFYENVGQYLQAWVAAGRSSDLLLDELLPLSS